MSDIDLTSNNYTAREKKTSKQAAYWTLAWGASIPLGIMLLKFSSAVNLFFAIAILLIHVAIGLIAIRSYQRWHGSLDELQRKIQLEALAIALGVLWLAIGCLLILNSANLLFIDHWVVSLLPALSGLAMLIGNFVGIMRHR